MSAKKVARATSIATTATSKKVIEPFQSGMAPTNRDGRVGRKVKLLHNEAWN